jgi:hypothetical protein
LLNKDPLKWKDIVVELSKQVVSTVDPDVRRQGDQLDVTSYVKVRMCVCVSLFLSLSLSIYIYIYVSVNSGRDMLVCIRDI